MTDPDQGVRPEIVDDPTELTAEWLTGALHSAGIDADVASIGFEPVGTGQLGSCYRMTIAYGRGQGPERLVVKLPSTDPSSRAAVAAGYRTEVEFYRRLASTLEIRTPECWFADISDDGTRFTLLMEDLAPAQQGDQITGCSVEQAIEAARNVARLHGPSWNRPEFLALDWLMPRVNTTAAMTGAFLADATKAFVARYPLEAAHAEVLEEFAGRFTIWAQGRLEPFSLVHNDYRLDNLLFAPPGVSGPVAAVDWQVLTVGLPARDLAFLVATGLEVEERRRSERTVLSEYHQALCAGGVEGYSAERCWEDYRYALFQAPLITVLGAYVARPTERGDRMFTVMARRACSAIRDLDALSLI